MIMSQKMRDLLQQDQYRYTFLAVLITIIYHILYYVLNLASRGNLGIRVGIEIAKHDAICQSYDPFSFARLMCGGISLFVVPVIITSTLMAFLLLEYGLMYSLQLLKFICGSWCSNIDV